jgi:hypothetical protein
MNPELARLQAYPFERLALLFKDRTTAGDIFTDLPVDRRTQACLLRSS